MTLLRNVICQSVFGLLIVYGRLLNTQQYFLLVQYSAVVLSGLVKSKMSRVL